MDSKRVPNSDFKTPKNDEVRCGAIFHSPPFIDCLHRTKSKQEKGKIEREKERERNCGVWRW